MIAEADKVKKISITEFKAHCTEEIRAIEEHGGVLEITRHGKTVASLTPGSKTEKPKTIGEWLKNHKPLPLLTEEEIKSLDHPTWSPEEWEEHPANLEEW